MVSFEVAVVGVDLSNKSECGLEEDDEPTLLGTTRATLKALMLISLDPASRRSCILCSSLPLNSWWSVSATSSTKCMMSLLAAESAQRAAAEQAADEEAREAAERAATQEAQRVEAEREAESAERAVVEQAAAEEAHQAPWSDESRQERICSLVCAFVWGEYWGRGRAHARTTLA